MEEEKENSDDVTFIKEETLKTPPKREKITQKIFDSAAKSRTKKLVERAISFRRRRRKSGSKEMLVKSEEDLNDTGDFKEAPPKLRGGKSRLKLKNSSSSSNEKKITSVDVIVLDEESATSIVDDAGDKDSKRKIPKGGSSVRVMDLVQSHSSSATLLTSKNDAVRAAQSGILFEGNEDQGKSTYQKCLVCGLDIDASFYKQHRLECLRSNFSKQSDGQHSAEGTETSERIVCPICNKNITHMNSQRQTQHMNRCMDKENETKEEQELHIQQLQKARIAVLGCPMCGKKFKTQTSRQSHLKKCALTNKMTVDQVKLLVKQQEEEHHVKLDAGILPEEFRLTKPKAQQSKSSKTSRPKNQLDEDTQLAMALSTSLADDHERQELEFLNIPGIAGGSELPVGPDIAQVPGRGQGKGKKGKQADSSTALLTTLSREEALQRLSHRVDRYVFSAMQADSVQLTPPFKTATKLQTTSSEPATSASLESQVSSILWSKTSLAKPAEAELSLPPSSEELQFYVRELMPPVSISMVMAGSKVKRVSAIPGRRRSDEMNQQSQEAQTTSSQSTPSSTQTVNILAELAMENDVNGEGSEIETAQPLSLSLPDMGDQLNTQSLSDVDSNMEASGFCRESPIEVTAPSSPGVNASYLSLVNSAQFSDVVILADQSAEIQAHKLILHARCPALLEISTMKDGKEVIDLSSSGEESVMTLLRYVYAGHISFFPSSVADIRQLAKRFSLPNLESAVNSAADSVESATKEGGAEDIQSTQKFVGEAMDVEPNDDEAKEDDGDGEDDDDKDERVMSFDDDDWLDVFQSQRESRRQKTGPESVGDEADLGDSDGFEVVEIGENCENGPEEREKCHDEDKNVSNEEVVDERNCGPNEANVTMAQRDDDKEREKGTEDDVDLLPKNQNESSKANHATEGNIILSCINILDGEHNRDTSTCGDGEIAKTLQGTSSAITSVPESRSNTTQSEKEILQKEQVSDGAIENTMDTEDKLLLIPFKNEESDLKEDDLLLGESVLLGTSSMDIKEASFVNDATIEASTSNLGDSFAVDDVSMATPSVIMEGGTTTMQDNSIAKAMKIDANATPKKKRKRKRVSTQEFRGIVGKIMSVLPGIDHSTGQQPMSSILTDEDMNRIAVKIEQDFQAIANSSDPNDSIFIPSVLDAIGVDDDDVEITHADIKIPFMKPKRRQTRKSPSVKKEEKGLKPCKPSNVVSPVSAFAPNSSESVTPTTSGLPASIYLHPDNAPGLKHTASPAFATHCTDPLGHRRVLGSNPASDQANISSSSLTKSTAEVTSPLNPVITSTGFESPGGRGKSQQHTTDKTSSSKIDWRKPSPNLTHRKATPVIRKTGTSVTMTSPGIPPGSQPKHQSTPQNPDPLLQRTTASSMAPKSIAPQSKLSLSDVSKNNSSMSVGSSKDLASNPPYNASSSSLSSSSRHNLLQVNPTAEPAHEDYISGDELFSDDDEGTPSVRSPLLNMRRPSDASWTLSTLPISSSPLASRVRVSEVLAEKMPCHESVRKLDLTTDSLSRREGTNSSSKNDSVLSTNSMAKSSSFTKLRPYKPVEDPLKNSAEVFKHQHPDFTNATELSSATSDNSGFTANVKDKFVNTISDLILDCCLANRPEERNKLRKGEALNSATKDRGASDLGLSRKGPSMRPEEKSLAPHAEYSFTDASTERPSNDQSHIERLKDAGIKQQGTSSGLDNSATIITTKQTEMSPCHEAFLSSLLKNRDKIQKTILRALNKSKSDSLSPGSTKSDMEVTPKNLLKDARNSGASLVSLDSPSPLRQVVDVDEKYRNSPGSSKTKRGLCKNITLDITSEDCLNSNTPLTSPKGRSLLGKVKNNNKLIDQSHSVNSSATSLCNTGREVAKRNATAIASGNVSNSKVSSSSTVRGSPARNIEIGKISNNSPSSSGSDSSPRKTKRGLAKKNALSFLTHDGSNSRPDSTNSDKSVSCRKSLEFLPSPVKTSAISRNERTATHLRKQQNVSVSFGGNLAAINSSSPVSTHNPTSPSSSSSSDSSPYKKPLPPPANSPHKKSPVSATSRSKGNVPTISSLSRGTTQSSASENEKASPVGISTHRENLPSARSPNTSGSSSPLSGDTKHRNPTQVSPRFSADISSWHAISQTAQTSGPSPDVAANLNPVCSPVLKSLSQFKTGKQGLSGEKSKSTECIDLTQPQIRDSRHVSAPTKQIAKGQSGHLNATEKGGKAHGTKQTDDGIWVDADSPLPLRQRLGLSNPFSARNSVSSGQVPNTATSKATSATMSISHGSKSGTIENKKLRADMGQLPSSDDFHDDDDDDVMCLEAVEAVERESQQLHQEAAPETSALKTPANQRVTKLKENDKKKKKNKTWKEPSPFTPMAPYDEMTTPDLKKAVSKIGVRPVGKKRMRELLKHVYHETHQYETDSDYDGTPIKRGRTDLQPSGLSMAARLSHQPIGEPSRVALIQNLPKKAAPKKTKTAALSQADKTGNKKGKSQIKDAVVLDDCGPRPSHSESSGLESEGKGDEEFPASQDSSYSDGPDFPEESILQGWPEEEEVTSTQLTQSSAASLTERLVKFVTDNKDIHENILMYEPLELDVLKQRITDAGIRVGMDKVLDFLDERCITFTMKNMGTRNTWRQGRARQKKSGKSPRKRKNPAGSSSQSQQDQ